jgi:cytochrome P450
MNELQHVPGTDGLPWFGETFAYLKDPFGWTTDHHKKYGPVFRANCFFQPAVTVAGAEFAERFLLDKEQVFSSDLGWQPIIGEFFHGGLMLRDFDVHRLHRRIMQVAFKRDALLGYLGIMRPILERAVQSVGSHVYPWVKQATLDAAAAIFLGLESAEDTRQVNQLFVEMMTAIVSPFRWDLPGTTYGRGLRARRTLRQWVLSLIPSRRNNRGRDMLSVLCNAMSEDGKQFSDDEIVDHLVFLLMAAHDTTTSALTTLIMELGLRPEWQARVREQSLALGNAPIDDAMLDKLDLVYDCFREVLRLHPPVRSIPRRAMREVDLGGYRLPANTQVWLNVEGTHRDPNIWTDPDAFDPERFSEPRLEHKKHRFAWVPFGGGAHTCLGLQFSELQVKTLMHLLLTRYEWKAEPSPMQYMPFIKPKNDLPLTLKPVQLASPAINQAV